MKLNPDCIRDILLSVEEICDMQNIYDSLNDKPPLLDKYSENDIEYHARQCNLSGFLLGYREGSQGGFSINDLTPKGHEFLANTRKMRYGRA